MNLFGLGFGTPAKARVAVTVAIAAPKDVVFRLIRDQSQRGRFLPQGWSFIHCLTEVTDQVGSQMEVETKIGPAMRRVIEILALDEDQLVEGPPLGENFVTTWTVLDRGDETAVELEMAFEYGGFIGELLVKRKLREAFTQQLMRLGAVALEERHRP